MEEEEEEVRITEVECNSSSVFLDLRINGCARDKPPLLEKMLPITCIIKYLIRFDCMYLLHFLTSSLTSCTLHLEEVSHSII